MINEQFQVELLRRDAEPSNLVGELALRYRLPSNSSWTIRTICIADLL